MKKQIKHYYIDKNKFRPYYRENGKTKYLGRFDTKEEAIAAYKKWEQTKEVEQLQQCHEVLISAKKVELIVFAVIVIMVFAAAIYMLKVGA